MTSLAVATPFAAALAAPEPRTAVSIRPAVQGDLLFVDQLQKIHGNAVGFQFMAALEQHVSQGAILIAEDRTHCPMGYILAKDRYKGQDHVGIVYQLNVAPIKQRGFIGLALLREFFARSAYGMRLCCCWCAQDLPANHFWEAAGFVPLAFRTGSRSKQRIHIFWQCRVRSGDTNTPWWFPSATSNGSIREDRVVLPIPPGTHWRDAKPVVLPGVPTVQGNSPGLLANGLPPARAKQQKAIPGAVGSETPAQRASRLRQQSKHLGGTTKGVIRIMTSKGFKYARTEEYVEPVKPKKAPQPRAKNDPALASACRELRDRYLEAVEANPIIACPKYDVTRQLSSAPITFSGILPCIAEPSKSPAKLLSSDSPSSVPST